MNSNQNSKSKKWSKSDSTAFLDTHQEVVNGVYGIDGGNMMSALRHVNSFADRVKEDRNVIFGQSLCLAASDNDKLTADYCKEKGADLNHHTYGDKTPLGCAEFFGHKKMADDLKRWGATDNAYGKPSSSLDKCSYSNQKKQSKGKNDEEECILM